MAICAAIKKQTSIAITLDVCATNFNPFVLAKDLHNFSEIILLDYMYSMMG